MTTDKTPATLAVDVLAAIDAAIEGIHGEGYECPDLEEAYGAIAELIEALDLAAYGEYLPESVEQQIRSALARVKGESA